MVDPFKAAMRRQCCCALQRFASDEDGAVTIDWVAITAGILLLGITLVYAIFNNGVGSVAGNINSSLAAAGTSVSTGAAPTQDTFGGGSDAPATDGSGGGG